MGTNYYLYQKPPCPTCGHHADEPLHIGKSSHGWCFSLHIIPSEGINTLKDWVVRWDAPGSVIKDEYGGGVTPARMMVIIEARHGNCRWDEKPIGYLNWTDFHAQNHSEEGLNGLLRHRVDGRYCIGHGEGTYDYMPGEFS